MPAACKIIRHRTFKRPARKVRVLASTANGFSGKDTRTQQQIAANKRYEDQTMTQYRVIKGTKAPLSGRALIYVAPYNIGVNVCAGERVATLAICSPSTRAAAEAGDVIITISPTPKRSKRTCTLYIA